MSLVLLRERLVEALSTLLKFRRPTSEPVVEEPQRTTPPAPPVVPTRSGPREPSMVVVEGHHGDDGGEKPRHQTADAAPEHPTPSAATDDDIGELFDHDPDLPVLDEVIDSLPSMQAGVGGFHATPTPVV